VFRFTALVPIGLALAPLLPAQSGYVALSKSLLEWKKEIEAKGGGKLIAVRVYTDPLRNEISLPADTEQRAILRRYFLDESFRGLLAGAHSLSVNYGGSEGKYHFVLLNMALAEQWSGQEEAVLADEFGHAWLSAQGYGAPDYRPGAEACVGVQAGNVVQHVLIREELERRGIRWREHWLRTLEPALEKLESGTAVPLAALPPCERLAQLALWVEVRMSLSAELWQNFSRFQQVMSKRYPETRVWSEQIESRLGEMKPAGPGQLPSREAYQSALGYALGKFTELYSSR
jgi:hypothetical protein